MAVKLFTIVLPRERCKGNDNFITERMPVNNCQSGEFHRGAEFGVVV